MLLPLLCVIPHDFVNLSSSVGLVPSVSLYIVYSLPAQHDGRIPLVCNQNIFLPLNIAASSSSTTAMSVPSSSDWDIPLTHDQEAFQPPDIADRSHISSSIPCIDSIFH